MPTNQKDLEDAIKNTIDIINGVANVGKASLEFLKNEKVQTGIKSSLSVVAGLGDIVKGIMKITGGADSPLLKEIQKLADDVEALGEKVSRNFDEMSAMITEINFFVEILSPIFNFMRLMRDCFRYYGKDANENFLKYYYRNPPLKLAFNLLTYLEQDCTNPLKLAMDAEKVKSKKTFDKWVDIFNRVLGQFLIIEAFAIGMQGQKDNFVNIIFLFDVIIEIFDKVHKMKGEYAEQADEDENKNWEEVRKFVEELPKNHPNLTNREVADKVEKKLNSFFTEFGMYLIVFDKSKEDIDYHFDIARTELDAALMIKSWEIEGWTGCNILIYRTGLGSQKKKEKYEHIKKQVENCKALKLTYDGSLKDIINYQLKMPEHLDHYPFSALIWDGAHPIIRSVYFPGETWGPGYWVKANVEENREGKKKKTYHYYLIASY